MSELASKLAKLANEQKQAQLKSEEARAVQQASEDQLRQANVALLTSAFASVVGAFNAEVDAPLQLTVTSAAAAVFLRKKDGTTLIWIDVAHNKAYWKHPSGNLDSTRDYFTITYDSNNQPSFSRTRVDQITVTEFVELTLQEALGLRI